jgi:hypothetical protein
MTVYKLDPEGIFELEATTFENEGILERSRLQLVLRTNIHVIDPDVLVIAEEFGDWDESRRRIDLLGVDRNGNLVIIELKRTASGGYMDLQALRYAAMVSTLTFEQAAAVFNRYLRSLGEEKDGEGILLSFLGWDEPEPQSFASDVRIVLVAADFSKELTTSVLWLNRKKLDIRCVRLKPYRHNEDIVLDVQQVIPLPEAAEYEIRIRAQQEERQESILSSKDYSRYTFEGKIYPKNRLVWAVVSAYLRDHPHSNLRELKEAFPDQLRPPDGVVVPARNALEIFTKTAHKRHFIEPEELLRTADGMEAAVSNQWGVGNISGFIDCARSLGYSIQKRDG